MQFAAKLRVEYPEGPLVLPGQELPLRIIVTDSIHINAMFKLRWKNLPEGWAATPEVLCCGLRSDCTVINECKITVGAFEDCFQDLELEIEMDGRRQRQTIKIPFQLKNSVNFKISGESEQSYRCRTRIVAGKQNCPLPENAMPQM